MTLSDIEALVSMIGSRSLPHQLDQLQSVPTVHGEFSLWRKKRDRSCCFSY
jgi:hypothetical protein